MPITTPIVTQYDPLPDGWAWGNIPRSDAGALHMNGTRQSEVCLRALDRWAEEHGIYVACGNRWASVTEVTVHFNSDVRASEQDFQWPLVWCRHGVQCGRHGYADPCTCETVPEPLVCAACGETNGRVAWAPNSGDYRCWNNECGQLCEARITPSERILRSEQPRWQQNTDSHSARYCTQIAEPGYNQCSDHDTRIECAQCEAHISMDYAYLINMHAIGEDASVCQPCYQHWCSRGRHFVDDHRTRRVDGYEGSFCNPCRAIVEADRYEVYDDDQDDAPAESVALTANEHRPIRTCSIEMETVNGGGTLATALARAGLSTLSGVQGYNSSRHFSNEFCHVERDSSLGQDGGELIFDRVRLDDPEDVGRMHAAMQIVRTLIKNGDLDMTMACGLHVHVDAHQMGVGDVRNLVLMTNYLEDILYRLSAAKYTKHRGTRYTQPLPKGPYPDRRTFGVQFLQQNGHESALNVGHYWSSMRNNCQCGASIVGAHEECSCNLGKCTFEFRYFNGTANFRKVQAYSSLCQSLVSYAKLADDMDEIDLPVMGYNEGMQAFSDEYLNEWDVRLRWMLTNLYFSGAERESLNYVACQSALSALGVERLVDIFETQYIRSEAPAQVIEHRNPRGSSSPNSEFFDGDYELEYDDERFDDTEPYDGGC